MSISRKVLLIMSLLVAILLGANFFVQKKIILPAFSEIELQQAKVNVDRIQELFDEAINELDRSAYDWSAWDDTYQFLEDRNQEYIDSNLSPGTFGNLQTNFIYILNLKGELVWGEVYDLTGEEAEIVTDDTFVEQSLLRLETSIKNVASASTSDLQVSRGLFIQDELPVIFSVRPVLTSEDQGPMRGYLILGKLCTDELLHSFQERIKTQFTLDVYVPKDADDSDAHRDIYQTNKQTGTSFTMSKTYFSNDQPVIRINTIFPGDITRNGLNSITYAMSTLFFIGVFSIVVVWVLLKITILAPISALSRQMLKISLKKDYTLRSEICRNDEIGLLTKEFNTMLSMIEQNNLDLENAYAHIKADNEIIAVAEAELRTACNELELLSITDPLTGIANRLYLERKLKDEWNTQMRARKPLSILMVDIDYFKPFNDRYGHQAGDKCLKQVAAILKMCLHRSTDVVARYGGEEFILVLPCTDISSAAQIAGNVLVAITDGAIKHLESEIAEVLTVSIGVASVTPSLKCTTDSLIKQADDALYVAKKNGRNRFEVAKDNLPCLA